MFGSIIPYIWFLKLTSMINSDLPEINLTGEKKVKQWLAENGYTNISEELLNATEFGLKAKGSIEDILVQVKTFLHPHRPFKLSDYQIDLLIRRAAKLNMVAYAAYVVLDANTELLEEINWERLS